jgi:hypothetical protein
MLTSQVEMYGTVSVEKVGKMSGTWGKEDVFGIL